MGKWDGVGETLRGCPNRSLSNGFAIRWQMIPADCKSAGANLQ